MGPNNTQPNNFLKTLLQRLSIEDTKNLIYFFYSGIKFRGIRNGVDPLNYYPDKHTVNEKFTINLFPTKTRSHFVTV